MNWNDMRVVVTGGASFIGSHLVERLIEMGAKVVVADDFSSGRFSNLKGCKNQVEIRRANLREYSQAKSVISEKALIFHLAAEHGGRAFIDTHPFECWSNITLDQLVFRRNRKRLQKDHLRKFCLRLSNQSAGKGPKNLA